MGFHRLANVNCHYINLKLENIKYTENNNLSQNMSLPWASWSPSVQSFWWWDHLLTPQTSWWRQSAPCLCFCTWRRRRRSPLRSFQSSRTSPSSGWNSGHLKVKTIFQDAPGSVGLSLQERRDTWGVQSRDTEKNEGNLSFCCFYEQFTQLKPE